MINKMVKHVPWRIRFGIEGNKVTMMMQRNIPNKIEKILQINQKISDMMLIIFNMNVVSSDLSDEILESRKSVSLERSRPMTFIIFIPIILENLKFDKVII
jgi:hypothetical protein